jgi:hypothetical protein
MAFDYLKIVITIALAVVGWLIAHNFTSRRDVACKRRDISLVHLINAYRILTNDISHRIQTDERTKLLENLLSDIQLFGSVDQVDMARLLASEVATSDEFELDPLINSLRDDLRTQLQLPPIEGNVKWLRFEKSEDEQ